MASIVFVNNTTREIFKLIDSANMLIVFIKLQIKRLNFIDEIKAIQNLEKVKLFNLLQISTHFISNMVQIFAQTMPKSHTCYNEYNNCIYEMSDELRLLQSEYLNWEDVDNDDSLKLSTGAINNLIYECQLDFQMLKNGKITVFEDMKRKLQTFSNKNSSRFLRLLNKNLDNLNSSILMKLYILEKLMNYFVSNKVEFHINIDKILESIDRMMINNNGVEGNDNNEKSGDDNCGMNSLNMNEKQLVTIIELRYQVNLLKEEILDKILILKTFVVDIENGNRMTDEEYDRFISKLFCITYMDRNQLSNCNKSVIGHSNNSNSTISYVSLCSEDSGVTEFDDKSSDSVSVFQIFDDDYENSKSIDDLSLNSQSKSMDDVSILAADGNSSDNELSEESMKLRFVECVENLNIYNSISSFQLTERQMVILSKLNELRESKYASILFDNLLKFTNKRLNRNYDYNINYLLCYIESKWNNHFPVSLSNQTLLFKDLEVHLSDDIAQFNNNATTNYDRTFTSPKPLTSKHISSTNTNNNADSKEDQYTASSPICSLAASSSTTEPTTSTNLQLIVENVCHSSDTSDDDDDDYDDDDVNEIDNTNVDINDDHKNIIIMSNSEPIYSSYKSNADIQYDCVQKNNFNIDLNEIFKNILSSSSSASSSSSESSKLPTNSEINANSSSSLISIAADSLDRDNNNGVGSKSETACKYCAFCSNYKSTDTNSNMENMIFVQDLDLALKLCEKSLEIEFLADEQTRQTFLQNKLKVMGKYKILNDTIEKEYADAKLNEIKDNKKIINEFKDRRSKHNSLRDDTIRDFEDEIKTEFFTDAIDEMAIDQSDACEREIVDNNENNCGNPDKFGSVEYRMSLCILLFERMLHISQYLMTNIVKSLEMKSTPISLKSTTIQLYCGYLLGFKNRFYFASHLIYNLIKVIEINEPVKNTDEWLDLLVNINGQCKDMLKYSIEVDTWVVSRFGEWVKSGNISGCSVLHLPDELLMKMDLNNDIRSVLIESTNRLFRVIQNLSTYPCYNELVKMIESCNFTSLTFDSKLWIVSNEVDDVNQKNINYQGLEKSCCELRKINAICAVNVMDLHDLLTRVDPSLSNSLSVENEINQILKAWRAVDNECHRLLRSTFLVFQIITDCRKKYLKLISLTLLIISIQRTDSLNTDSSTELDNYLNQLQQYKERIKNWLNDLELCSIVIRRKQITNKRFKYYLEIYQYLKENLNIIDHLSESIIVKISQVNHYKNFLLILFEIFNYLANKKVEFQIFDLDIAGCVLLNKMIDNRCFYDVSHNDTIDVEEKVYGNDSHTGKSCNNNVTDIASSPLDEDIDESVCRLSCCYREYMECNVISATMELEELTQKMEKSLVNQSNRRLDNCMHQWFEASINAYMALVGDDNTSKIADGLATLNEDNDIFVCTTRVTGDHEVVEDQDFVSRIINNASACIMERIINIATTAAGNALLYYIDKSPCTSSNLSQMSPSVNLKKPLFCPNTMSNKVRLLIRIDVQNRLIDAALVVLVDQIVTDSFINSSSNEISQYLLLDISRHLLRETIALSAQSISQSALFQAPLMIFNKIATQILDKSATCFVNFFNVQQKRLHSITNTNLIVNNTPVAKSPSCNNSVCDSIPSLSENLLETGINFIKVPQLTLTNSAKSVSKNSLNLLESKLLQSSQYTFEINQISRRAFVKFCPSIGGKIPRLSSEEDLDIKQDKVALLIAKFDKTDEHSLILRVCEIMTDTCSAALFEELVLQFCLNVKLHQKIPNFVWLQSGQNMDWEKIDKLRKNRLKSILKRNVNISRYKFKELYTVLKADFLTQIHVKDTVSSINFSIQETELNNHFDYNKSTSFVNTEHAVYISQPTELNDLLIDESFSTEFGELNLDLAPSTTDYLTNHSTPYYSTKIHDSFAPTSSISITPDTKELTLEPDSDETSPFTIDDVDPIDKRVGLLNSQIVVDYHAASKFNFQTSQDNHIRQKKLNLINEVGQQTIYDDDIIELETEPMNTSADLKSQISFTSQITIVPSLDNHNRNINYCHSHQSQIYTPTTIENEVVYYNQINIPLNKFSENNQIDLVKTDKCIEVKCDKEPVNSNSMLFLFVAIVFLMFILTFVLIFYGELLNFGRFGNLLPKVCSGGLPF